MTIIKDIENILKQGGIKEAKAEAKLIVEIASGLKIEEILFGKIQNEDKIYEIARIRTNTKHPIQYILGFSYFMGEKYIVNENVLIPRDETEILVRNSYELLKERKNKIDVLEIGIGSGCISCELAKKLKDKDIEILGVDISSDALSTALDNISNQNLIRKIIVRKSDIYSKIRENEKFDLIVSNPPYIPKKEKENLEDEVKKEPDIALFSEDDEGISFYQKIIQDAPKYLKKDGFIAFELGINQSGKVKSLLEENFIDIKITKDLQNIERTITARLNSR